MGIPRQRQVFLTGTLPGGGHAAYQTLANYSGYIMNRLKRWVAGYQEAKLDMYVWELQKRGALHLHYFVVADTDEIAARLISGFKSKWIDILDDVSVQAKVNLFRSEKGIDWRDCPSKIQAYAQSVYASAAAYLAKYCSKQSSQHSSKQSSKYFPSRWWGCSRALLAAMRERIVKFQINGLKAQAARRWYNRIIDKVEGHALTFYSYGERKGYQLFSVAYDHFHNSISIMGDVSCLRIFATDYSQQLAIQQAQRAVQIICLAHSKPRLWSILQRDARTCCGRNPLTPGTFPSIKVSSLIVLLQSLESKLLLYSQDVRAMTGMSLSRWVNMISSVEAALRMFIESTQSDWEFVMLPLPVLHCALTRPDYQTPEL
jgi:hypothetical protein